MILMTGNMGWGITHHFGLTQLVLNPQYLAFDANFSRVFPILGLPRELYLPLMILAKLCQTISSYILLVRPIFFAGEWQHSNVCWLLVPTPLISTGFTLPPGSIAHGGERSHTDLRRLHRMSCVAECSLATKLSWGDRGGREGGEGAMSFIDFLRFFVCRYFHVQKSLHLQPGDGFHDQRWWCVKPLGPSGQHVTDQAAKRSSQHVVSEKWGINSKRWPVEWEIWWSTMINL